MMQMRCVEHVVVDEDILAQERKLRQGEEIG